MVRLTTLSHSLTMSVMFQAPQLVDFCTGLQVLLHLGYTFSGHTTHSQPGEIWL